jgi:hypothetical protein
VALDIGENTVVDQEFGYYNVASRKQNHELDGMKVIMSHGRSLWLWSLYILLFFCSAGGETVERFPPERDKRGSAATNDLRYEGIRQYEDVNAGQLTLKSAIIQYKEKPDTNSSQFNLLFYIDDIDKSDSVDILLEDKIGKSYYMIPANTKWRPGVNSFRWDGSFAGDSGIGLYDLYAKAEVVEPLVTTIFPIALYYDNKLQRVERYSFILISTRQVTVKYDIYDDEDTIKTSGVFRRHAANTDIEIIWDSGHAKEGRYWLELEYTFISGGPVQTLYDTYEFYHTSTITEPN